MPDRIDVMDTTQETDVDERVKHFERLIDKNDPEQVKMLEEMKKHTSLLHHVRGDWNKPNTFRHWNEPLSEDAIKRIPMESETYRKYKEHMIRENTPLLEIAMGQGQSLQIMGRPAKLEEEEDISVARQGMLHEND